MIIQFIVWQNSDITLPWSVCFTVSRHVNRAIDVCTKCSTWVQNMSFCCLRLRFWSALPSSFLICGFFQNKFRSYAVIILFNCIWLKRKEWVSFHRKQMHGRQLTVSWFIVTILQILPSLNFSWPLSTSGFFLKKNAHIRYTRRQR